MEEAPQRVEVPAVFEDVEADVLVDLIADMMERLMAHNDRIPLSPEALTRFHSRSAPGISVLDYFRRIVRFTRVERVCLLITLHYIDQICARTPLFTLSSLTCHRFVIAAITIASKTFCDVFCTNSVYAKVGGIPVDELNMLEREFLRMIDWQLTCTREVLQEYYVNLVRTHSKGIYYIPAPESSSSLSSDSDTDLDMGGPSRPSTPATESAAPSGAVHHPYRHCNTVSRASAAPTLEQNMAFADFHQSSQEHPERHPG
ncbi:cyclin-domain-containing protein [Fomitopsis serialis]|uniref:cyclin-domain-containing protein n=1 Tax=Fomitopsis serialis TaxID=139415 RepID=UPI002007B277|nr:cyclin-domain-containing protein [Neoantrodia serialis]KAH9920074.1 cyclin-domain-containing protein [Neoantrodia serialis]